MLSRIRDATTETACCERNAACFCWLEASPSYSCSTPRANTVPLEITSKKPPSTFAARCVPFHGYQVAFVEPLKRLLARVKNQPTNMTLGGWGLRDQNREIRRPIDTHTEPSAGSTGGRYRQAARSGPVRDLGTISFSVRLCSPSTGLWALPGLPLDLCAMWKRNTPRRWLVGLFTSRTVAGSSAPLSLCSSSLPTTTVSVGSPGHLIWQPALAGDTDGSRQLIKRFPAYCRAATWLCSVGYPFHRASLSPSLTRRHSLRPGTAPSPSRSRPVEGFREAPGTCTGQRSRLGS